MDIYVRDWLLDIEWQSRFRSNYTIYTIILSILSYYLYYHTIILSILSYYPRSAEEELARIAMNKYCRLDPV